MRLETCDVYILYYLNRLGQNNPLLVLSQSKININDMKLGSEWCIDIERFPHVFLNVS